MGLGQALVFCRRKKLHSALASRPVVLNGTPRSLASPSSNSFAVAAGDAWSQIIQSPSLGLGQEHIFLSSQEYISRPWFCDPVY